VADLNSTQEGITKAIADVSERATALVKEEIELAKAEIKQKIDRFARGIVVAIAAGVFAVFGITYLLDAIAWGVWKGVFGGDHYWAGFLLVALVLFALGGISGWLAHRWLRTTPEPTMAIEEAKLIRETVAQAADPDSAETAPTATPGTPATPGAPLTPPASSAPATPPPAPAPSTPAAPAEPEAKDGKPKTDEEGK